MLRSPGQSAALPEGMSFPDWSFTRSVPAEPGLASSGATGQQSHLDAGGRRCPGWAACALTRAVRSLSCEDASVTLLCERQAQVFA